MESENLYGQVGLLDMPSARFMPDGEISFTTSTTPAMDRYALGFQAVPWLEATFRYSRIDTYLPNFDLYDRSLGFKIRLSKEDDFWPAIAVGAMDIIGTGAFGAEYLVGSKRIGDFDTTLGIGWRRFGGTAPFENPFGLIFPSFKTIDTSFGVGGAPDLKQFFHGPQAGLFGGITWDTPIDGLRLIAEVSGDKYTAQTTTGKVHLRSPLNLGFSYEPISGVQIGGGYLYGSELGVRLTIHFNPITNNPGEPVGAAPTPSQIRSPEDRKEAVLAFIQDKTHFYSNDPFRKPTLTIGLQASEASQPSLADTLFDDAVYRKLDVQNVESFGSDLIVSVPRSQAALACQTMNDLSRAAHAAGFQEIVFSRSDGAPVQICDTGVSPAQPRPRMASTVEETATASTAGTTDNPEPSAPTDQTAAGAPDVLDLRTRIIQSAKDQGLQVAALSIDEHRIRLAFINKTYLHNTEAIGRLLRILMADAPTTIEEFSFVDITNYLPTNAVTLSRSDVERTLNLSGSAIELWPLTEIKPVPENTALLGDDSLISFPKFDYSITPNYRQSLFDPQNPFAIQLYANAEGSVAFTQNFSVDASLEYDAYSTINTNRKSDSVLPHVRSDFAEYYSKKFGISDIEATYFKKFAPDIYFQGRAGYLEDMFAGVGGEIYWQPPHQRWALGASLYGVQQRSFDRLFGLRNYRIITGHIAAYYDSPFYGLNFEVHAGRYLAGDYGATFQITRRFASGVEIGAYATLTNVPFKTFGEGSFDKGIIIRIPVGAIAPINTQSVARLDFSPITRDGGARLYGEETLHDTLQRSSENELIPTWNSILEP
ncbi:MAG: YjbH domain-containing protein [Proteobacteria bacterium]|nr:YjbH domain-containing protein [Pseudomonadota bacterium]